MPFRCFLLLTIAIFVTCSTPAKSEEVGPGNHDQLTEQSCMGARALIDLEEGIQYGFARIFTGKKAG